MNYDDDDNKEILLLIVLTDAAKKSIGKSDIQEDLYNLDNINLFKWKDKKKPDDKFIAIPVNKGKQTLLLTLEEKRYFTCITVLSKKTHINTDSKFCHELPKNYDAMLLENSSKVRNYDNINHYEIFTEIQKKEYWRPYESNNIEERKWNTYLKLHKTIIKNQKVDFYITDIKISKNNLTAILDKKLNETYIEKIQNARGERLNFSLNQKQHKAPILGDLTRVNTKQATIKLDKNFQKLLKELIHDKDFQVITSDCEEVRVKCVYNNEKIIDSVKTTFCDFKGVPLFTANAKHPIKKLEQDNDINEIEKTQKIDEEIFDIEKDSIQLLKLLLSAEFGSDLYQIKVMQDSLEKIKTKDIWQVLSGERVAKLPDKVDTELNNPILNEQQKNAIKGALGASELFLIWGPPGTGKTEVIKEISEQEVLKGNKVLICSQSNLAVDNALARLDNLSDVYPIRIAKDKYKMEGEDNNKVPFKESAGKFFIKELQGKLKNTITDNASSQYVNLQKQFLSKLDKALKTNDKENKDDFELREFQQHTDFYHKNINIVGTTLMEAGKTQGKDIKLCKTTGIKEFDVVIIDEVSKATPPELFIPVSLGKRLILVGDHRQLPPMFKMLSGDDKTQEEWAKEANIEESELDIDSTIFERLWDKHAKDANSVRAMLTKQYRMHPKIQRLIEPFYTDSEGSLSFGFGLENAEAIDNLTLSNVDFCNNSTIWIRSTEKIYDEEVGTSYINRDEIEKVGKLLNMLSKRNDKKMSVGVITFYGAQLKEMRQEYEQKYKNKFSNGKLIFGTVDRFQGRECDVIICSLVRNNKYRKIGFASKINRINVAFSRAKKCLIILGSKKQFCHEAKNKKALKTYKEIYDKCYRTQPKDINKL